MPNLNDYIGSLVSSFTNARIMSDLQTVKVAEEYLKHNLLKHFSVPRMRIDDVEMTIPVAIDEISEKTETEYEPIDNTKFNSLVYRELINNLGVTSLPNKLSVKLRSQIAERTHVLEQNIRSSKSLSPLGTYSDEMVLNLREVHKEIDTGNLNIKFEVIAKQLEKILSQEIKIHRQIKSLENINIVIESHKLREVKPENIIYIKLKISEDGMEWNRAEAQDGQIEEKLLPE